MLYLSLYEEVKMQVHEEIYKGVTTYVILCTLCRYPLHLEHVIIMLQSTNHKAEKFHRSKNQKKSKNSGNQETTPQYLTTPL